MFTQIARSFARLLPPMPAFVQAASPHADEPPVESGWHVSSWELSHGLEVVEFNDATAVFPDTLPAFHEPASTLLAA